MHLLNFPKEILQSAPRTWKEQYLQFDPFLFNASINFQMQSVFVLLV
jgi:hypothetical protein